MYSGVLYSNAATIDGLIDRIADELGEPVTAIATGGVSRMIVPACRREIMLHDTEFAAERALGPLQAECLAGFPKQLRHVSNLGGRLAPVGR